MIFGLITPNHWHQVVVKESLKLLSQRTCFVLVLHVGSSDDSLEELSLKNDLVLIMDVIRLDSKLLVKLGRGLFVFFFLVT